MTALLLAVLVAADLSVLCNAPPSNDLSVLCCCADAEYQTAAQDCRRLGQPMLVLVHQGASTRMLADLRGLAEQKDRVFAVDRLGILPAGLHWLQPFEGALWYEQSATLDAEGLIIGWKTYPSPPPKREIEWQPPVTAIPRQLDCIGGR